MNKRPFILSFLISVLFIFGLLTPFISRDAVDAKMQHPLLSQTELFVVNTSEECEPYETTLCFFNHESLDELDGEGTGLRAAIKHAKENLLSGIKINIVADYKIKTFPVLIDFPVVINGFDNAKITTQEPNCDHAMLNIIESVTIQNLIIDDGACYDVSRDLIVVNSPNSVTIQKNTLENGKNAILFKDNSGNLSVFFNDIRDNTLSAIRREAGTSTGKLKLTGNMITNNNPGGNQVFCHQSALGNVNHNYWGENVFPSSASENCTVDDNKRLGAEPRQLSAGIAGEYINLERIYSDPFFGGFSAKSDQPGNALFVIDHDNNQPFIDKMPPNYELTHCGKFYDVFMDENSTASLVSLRFSYDNSPCAEVINSQQFCASNNENQYPLMWFDPKYGSTVTHGYDNVGAEPEGTGRYFGQTVRCNTANRTIETDINNAFTQRPNLIDDLNYTPFTIGFDKTVVEDFTSSAAGSTTITLTWSSFSEANMTHYRLLKSDKSNGEFKPIGNDFSRKGDVQSGENYKYIDTGLSPETTYYYKLVVFNGDTIQQTFGPIEAKTNALEPTNTHTPTRTSTQGRPTSTPYPISNSPTPTGFVYRSPTSTSTKSSVKTSTPLPELTQNSQHQTMTAFFTTQTARYSDRTPAVDETPSYEDTSTEIIILNTSTEESQNINVTFTPSPTQRGVNTDKSSRYHEEQSTPKWVFWLLLIVFGGYGIYLGTRKNIH